MGMTLGQTQAKISERVKNLNFSLNPTCFMSFYSHSKKIATVSKLNVKGFVVICKISHIVENIYVELIETIA